MVPRVLEVGIVPRVRRVVMALRVQRAARLLIIPAVRMVRRRAVLLSRTILCLRLVRRGRVRAARGRVVCRGAGPVRITLLLV